MKNLFALFSAKKVTFSLSDLDVEALKFDDLRKIRGGGEPANREEENIIIAD